MQVTTVARGRDVLAEMAELTQRLINVRILLRIWSSGRHILPSMATVAANYVDSLKTMGELINVGMPIYAGRRIIRPVGFIKSGACIDSMPHEFRIL